ncbi:MAG: DUF4124 domain-containing protein [Pseudomonadales bacterium]
MKLRPNLQHPGVLVLTLLLALITSADNSFAQVYKTVDDDGKASFSDKPNPSAEKVELRAPNTAKPIETSAKASAPAKAATAGESYQVSISSPQNNALVVNGLVPFTVSTQVSPTLQKEHQLQLSIDGSIYGTSKQL